MWAEAHEIGRGLLAAALFWLIIYLDFALGTQSVDFDFRAKREVSINHIMAFSFLYSIGHQAFKRRTTLQIRVGTLFSRLYCYLRSTGRSLEVLIQKLGRIITGRLLVLIHSRQS